MKVTCKKISLQGSLRETLSAELVKHVMFEFCQFPMLTIKQTESLTNVRPKCSSSKDTFTKTTFQ